MIDQLHKYLFKLVAITETPPFVGVTIHNGL
jgi:hypothetical protein